MPMMILSRLRLPANAALLALSALLTAGCAGLTPRSDTAMTPQAMQTATPRHYRDTLDLDGRLSVQYQRNNQDESLHGSFTWRQTAQRNAITLLSPLGQTLATITVEPGSATLTESGKAPRTASDVDALAAQSLGWPLPVAGLRDWLQGFATDANGRRFVASPDADSVTTSDGWRLHYVSWDDSDPADIRPRRIDLARETEQAGDVSIRIVIDNWQAR